MKDVIKLIFAVFVLYILIRFGSTGVITMFVLFFAWLIPGRW